jgi:hypothetical protein
MSRVEWVVCERTSRWASALRMACGARGMPYRLREIRHLAELEAELVKRPACLAAVEFDRANFAAALALLPAMRKKFPGARSVALLDRSLASDFAAVRDAVVEAGAAAVAASPRRLDAILALGQRHAATVHTKDESLPFAARIWTTLPWQAV